MSPSTSGGIVSSMMVEYRADKCDDSESNGYSHLELGTRIICHDRPLFSRASFKLLGYGVCPVDHPVNPRQLIAVYDQSIQASPTCTAYYPVVCS